MRQIGLFLFLILTVSACATSDDSLPTQLNLPAPTKTLIPTQAQALSTQTLTESVVANAVTDESSSTPRPTSTPIVESITNSQMTATALSRPNEPEPTVTNEPDNNRSVTNNVLTATTLSNSEPKSTSISDDPTPTTVLTATALPSPTEPESSTATDAPNNDEPFATSIPVTDTPIACNLQDDWDEYTVQRGDNLVNIANRTGSTIDELTSANCLENPNRLRAGQALYVPNSPEQSPTPALTVTSEPIAVPTSQATEAGDSPSFSVSIKKTYQSEKGFSLDYSADWTLLETSSATVNNIIITSFEYTLGDEIPQNRWTEDMVSIALTIFQETTDQSLLNWTQSVVSQFQNANNIAQVNAPVPFETNSDLVGQRIDYISSDDVSVSNVYFIINNHKVQISVGGNFELAESFIRTLELADA